MHEQRLQTTYRGMTPTGALEAAIRRKAARLARTAPGELLRCHVTLKLDVVEPRSSHPEARYLAAIDMHVRGRELAVGHDHGSIGANNPYVAVRDAFRAAHRLLEHRCERSDRRREEAR